MRSRTRCPSHESPQEGCLLKKSSIPYVIRLIKGFLRSLPRLFWGFSGVTDVDLGLVLKKNLWLVKKPFVPTLPYGVKRCDSHMLGLEWNFIFGGALC